MDLACTERAATSHGADHCGFCSRSQSPTTVKSVAPEEDIQEGSDPRPDPMPDEMVEAVLLMSQSEWADSPGRSVSRLRLLSSGVSPAHFPPPTSNFFFPTWQQPPVESRTCRNASYCKCFSHLRGSSSRPLTITCRPNLPFTGLQLQLALIESRPGCRRHCKFRTP